jgi:hypothetical protein
MEAFKPRRTGQARPEAKIQNDLIKYLRHREWYVKVLHGSTFQSGMPDLFCTHALHGIRLVEVKLPGMKGSKFTPAQLRTFPQLCANGAKVWVLTGATDSEYAKLWKPCNWASYLGVLK